MAVSDRIKTINGEDIYEPSCGASIDVVAGEVLQAARTTGRSITMTFNDTRLKVTGAEANGQAIVDAYFAARAKEAEAYANSPAGKRAAAREAAAQAREQGIIDTLVQGKLDGAIAHGIAGVLGWMKEYAAHADNNTLNHRYDEIIPKLQAAGYRSDAHVHDDKTGVDLRVSGLYIVGQCLSCMEGGMPPHPGMAAAYIRQYEELRKTSIIPVMHPLTLNGKTPTAPVTTIPLLKKMTIKLKGAANG